MRIAFLTGIWPPDVGGPATHGPEFAEFLRDHGHDVSVVTMADQAITQRPVPVVAVDRTRPFVVRYPRVAAAAFRLARPADVVYATSTYAAAAAAATAARTPLVVKLVSDPAYERAYRYGLFSGSLDDFQSSGDVRVRTLKRLRTLALRPAARVVVPSRYLADLARRWDLRPEAIEVLVNPAPSPSGLEPAGFDEPTFVFVGRLTEQKSLWVALQALRSVPGAQLVVLGDGPLAAELARSGESLGVSDRVSFRGAASRESVLRHLAGARAAVLPSSWENMPHAALEALSVGTPVIATAVGGVPEVVRDGENGLLVPPGDPARFAEAMNKLLDEDVRSRLAAQTRGSVAGLSADATYTRLASMLEDATR